MSEHVKIQRSIPTKSATMSKGRRAEKKERERVCVCACVMPRARGEGASEKGREGRAGSSGRAEQTRALAAPLSLLEDGTGVRAHTACSPLLRTKRRQTDAERERRVCWGWLSTDLLRHGKYCGSLPPVRVDGTGEKSTTNSEAGSCTVALFTKSATVHATRRRPAKQTKKKNQ